MKELLLFRHASWETTRRHYAPGDVQKDAGIKRLLNRPLTVFSKRGPAEDVTADVLRGIV
jgi:hypothetical protein